MLENIKIDNSKYIFDWRNGYIMIIDLDRNKYIRFWTDDMNINELLKILSFKEIIESALTNEYGQWNLL